MKIAEEATWFLSLRGVKVWDSASSQFRILSFQESLLWELIARGIPANRWGAILTTVLGTERGEGPAMPPWVANALLSWSELGWVKEDIQHG